MSAKRSVLLHGAALAVLMVSAVAQPSAAQTTATFPGFNPSDPFNSAAGELWRLVKQHCIPPGREVTVGTGSLPSNVMAFTRDQGTHLMSAVNAAFSRIPDVKLSPFADVGAIIEVQSAGLTATPAAGNVESLLNKVDIVVTGNGQKVGPNTVFSISAVGRNGIECFRTVGPFAIPGHLAGEPYVPAENIFGEAAKTVWTKSRGSNQIVVKARTINGVPLDYHLPGHFRSLMSRAIADAEKLASETSIGNPTRVSVIGPEGTMVSAEQRWDADVVVEQRREGYKITIEVSRHNETPVFAGGLVLPDDMPALQWSALTQGGVGTQRPAANLRLGPLAISRQGQVGSREREQRYAFSLQQESYVEIDLPIGQVTGGRSLAVDVVDRRNARQNTIHIPVGSRPNLRRYRLGPGDYTVKVAGVSQGQTDYRLRARAVEVSEMLAPEGPGHEIAPYEDWKAGVTVQDGRKICYAYTAAREVEPAGWREQLPYMWMSVVEGSRGDVNHLIDDKRYYEPGTQFDASIDTPTMQRSVAVGSVPDGNFIWPVRVNEKGLTLLDLEAVEGYNQGQSLELRGVARNGKDARVVYSLKGYRSALQTMTSACRRPDIADRLVWAK